MTLKTKPLGKHCGVIVSATPGETLSTLKRDDVIECFKEHGAVIFSGYKNDTDSFTYFTEQLTGDFSRYEGGAQRYGPLNREQIGNNETLLSTSGSKLGFSIPLHGEMYYWNEPPELLWFYCSSPPAEKSGGQTTICDASKAFEHLKPNVRDFFTKNKIKYIRSFGPTEWQGCFFTESIDEVKDFCESRGGTFVRRDDGGVTSEFITSAFRMTPDGHKPIWINNLQVFLKGEQSFHKSNGSDKVSPLVIRMEDGSVIPTEIQKALEESLEPITQDIPWKQGDVAMIDNRWILHGRRKADPTSGRAIFVRMGKASFK